MILGPGQAGWWSRSSWVVHLLVLILLAGWWALLLPRAEKSVFARVPVLDEVYYLDRSLDEDPPPQGYFISPLYPRLLALTGSAISLPEGEVARPADLRGIRLLHLFCWLGTVFLIRATAARALARAWPEEPPAGWLSWLPAAGFALYRPAAVYSLAILLELPLVFLTALFFFLLTHDSKKPWLALALGLTLGTAGLLRGSVLVLGILAAGFLWRQPFSWKKKTLQLGLLSLAVLVPLLPATVYNSRQAGRLTGPTLNGGVNLYVGNGPQANGFYVAAIPGDWRLDPAGRRYLADRLDLPEVSLAQADSIWARYAWDSIAEHPGSRVRLWAKKWWLHLQAWEIDQLTPLSGWTRQVPLLRAHFLPYGWLVVLGLAGLAASWRQKGFPWVWALGLALLISAQSVFFVVSRYRLVLVPLWCLLSGFGLAHMFLILRNKLGSWQSGYSWQLWVLGAALGLAVIVPWGLEDVQARWLPLAQANEARRWGVLGQAESSPRALSRAAELYRQSIGHQPDSPGPWLGLAIALRDGQNRDEARAVLAEGILKVGRDLELRRMLVGMLIEDDLRSDALAQAQALLRQYPDDAETLHNTVVLLAGYGNTDAALKMAERLVQAHPHSPRGAIDLGVLLARSGQKDRAREAFLQGLAANPDHPEILQNLQLLDRSP